MNDKVTPRDIQDAYSMLGQMFQDLTDCMQEEVREWRSELKAAVKQWKDGGDEPNWNDYRESMNEICRDDGMPALFEAESGEVVSR